MPEVSLAKALKLKNKQARKVADLRKRIEQYNSVAEGASRPFDIDSTYEELLEATDRLVRIKSAISLANGPIQEAIYRAAELRGTAAFLRGLPIQDGPSPAYYGAASTVFEAALNAADIEEKVEALETEADDLQDRIDAHNATVRITVAED